MRKLTGEALAEIGELILTNNKPKLLEIANSQTEPAIRVIYARAAANAMVKGDVETLERILNRVIGPVKQKLEHSGNLKLEDILGASSEDKDD